MEDKIGEVFGAENFEGFDEAMRPLYTVMTKHVSLMKKKLGGDFAVAHAVATRTSRWGFLQIYKNLVQNLSFSKNAISF